MRAVYPAEFIEFLAVFAGKNNREGKTGRTGNVPLITGKTAANNGETFCAIPIGSMGRGGTTMISAFWSGRGLEGSDKHRYISSFTASPCNAFSLY
jgi:hypothetical protein